MKIELWTVNAETPALTKLRVEANNAVAFRGHAIRWNAPVFGREDCTRSIQNGVCANPNCHGDVQLDTRPDPNGIDTGGSLLAQSCPIIHE